MRAAPGRWDRGMGFGTGFRMEVEIPLTSAKGLPAARGLQPRSPPPAPPPATGDGGGQRPAEARHPLRLRYRPWYIPGTTPVPGPVQPRYLRPQLPAPALHPLQRPPRPPLRHRHRATGQPRRRRMTDPGRGRSAPGPTPRRAREPPSHPTVPAALVWGTNDAVFCDPNHGITE